MCVFGTIFILGGSLLVAFLRILPNSKSSTHVTLMFVSISSFVQKMVWDLLLYKGTQVCYHFLLRKFPKVKKRFLISILLFKVELVKNRQESILLSIRRIGVVGLNALKVTKNS